MDPTAGGYDYGYGMAGMGIFMPGLVLLYVVLALWFGLRILHRAGYSGWWVLTQLIPAVNLIMIWVFAFADWPALKGRRRSTS